MSLQILSFINLSDKQIEFLHKNRPGCNIVCRHPREAMDFLSYTDILLGYDAQINMDTLLFQMPKLQWVHTYSAGVENILSSASFSQSNILLTNSRGIHGIPMAEHILGTMLLISRCLIEAWENKKSHQWKRLTNPDELYGKTATIIGLGSIGREVAKYLKNIGMHVLAVKQKESVEPFVDNLFTMEHLQESLSNADYVIVTRPLTPQTKNLFLHLTYPLFEHFVFPDFAPDLLL